jgi:hypothetical protein
LIIKELEKRKDELGIKGSVRIFYKKFEPHVIPLGEFYMFLLNKKIKTRTLKKTKQTKQTKLSKLSKKSTSSKSKGGFLFMLTDKGKEPITGDDLKKVIKKYNKVLGHLYYTRYGRDSTVVKGEDGEIKADLAQPYTAIQAIMGASIKDVSAILTNRGTDALAILQDPGDLIYNFREYFNIYKTYMREYYKSEALKDPEIKRKIEIATRLGQGPPKEPDLKDKFLAFVGADTRSVYNSEDMKKSEKSLYAKRGTVSFGNENENENQTNAD